MSYISAQLSKDRANVLVWERHNKERRLVRYKTPLYFYMEDKQNGKHTSIYGQKLNKVTFPDYQTFYETKKELKQRNIQLFESDIKPEYKILSEHYYNKEITELHITLFDIECDYDPLKGFPYPEDAYAPINAISIFHKHNNRKIVYAVPSESYNEKEIDKLREVSKLEIVICKNEKQLLNYIITEFDDSDILSGWNSAIFDIPYIYERLKRILGEDASKTLSFADATAPKYREYEKFGVIKKELQIFGRISLDYLEIFKKYEQHNRASYALEFIAEEELPNLPKLSSDIPLHILYKNYFTKFVEYNIRDTDILEGLEKKFGYIDLAVKMSHMNTSLINDVLGSVKMIENAIINYCHQNLNLIVLDTKEPTGFGGKFAGALVLDPIVGMHENIAAIDLISLYPTTIRTLNVSPEMIIGQFYDKHLAYEQIRNKTNDEITLLYENSMSETKTANEWYNYLLDAKWAISGYGTVFSQEKTGIIPSIIAEWFAQRRKYKEEKLKYSNELTKLEKDVSKKIKDKLKQEEEQADRLNYIYKIFLNSIYGCCGNEYFRFYDIRMAESTTRSGRDILMHMVKTVALKLDGEYKYPSKSIVYGDTDSTFFLTNVESSDEALEVAKVIARMVNKSFQPFVKQNFCCQENFSNLMKAEQEIISDRGIFVDKKMYILHLSKKDGKDVDDNNDMKVMGVSLKKTTLPKIVRNKLTEILKDFLKGKSWNDISLEIVSFKEQLNDTKNILEIGLPKQVKNVEQYTKKYKNNEEGLRLPGHVGASIFWNDMLDYYKDTESNKIVSGTKIKTFYLNKGSRPEKFNSIAVPTDLNIVPDWFKQDFYGIIDKEAQLKRLIDMPLKSILIAIGKLVPSRKSIAIEELFE